MYVYEYDWTPDGKAWAATAAHGSGDANWWIAGLYLVNAQSGQMHEIYKPKLQIAEPHVSPDGKNVAFIEGLMSDAGLTGGEIHVVPADGGAARNLTPNSKTSPSALAWKSPDVIVFAQNADGNSSFATVTVVAGCDSDTLDGRRVASPRPVDAWVSGGSFSRDGSVTAIVRQSAVLRRKSGPARSANGSSSPGLNAGVKPPGARCATCIG
jgi:dipeptidyl aminopeptidase/acylaminoacyl peptidase